MAWDTEFTDTCLDWWHGLTIAEQEGLGHSLDLLEHFGPALARPYVDTLKGSCFPNMKELRAQYAGPPVQATLRI